MTKLESIETATEICDKIILWQDYTHPNGYRPTLKLLVFPDGKQALELNVFGNATVVPFIKAERSHEQI